LEELASCVHVLNRLSGHDVDSLARLQRLEHLLIGLFHSFRIRQVFGELGWISIEPIRIDPYSSAIRMRAWLSGSVLPVSHRDTVCSDTPSA
jgi:hypothetical protein